MRSGPPLLPVPEGQSGQFVLTDAAVQQGRATPMLQLFVDMAPERGYVSLKAHLVFWHTIAACLRRVGNGDDTAVTLARTIEAAMKTPMDAYNRPTDRD